MKNLGMVEHIVPILAPINLTATQVMPHVALKKFEKVKFLISFGVCGTASFVLTVTCSAATAGSSSTAIAFKYRATASATAGSASDALGDLTDVASTGLTLTYGTVAGKTYAIEVNGSELTADKPYVGLTFTDPGTADAITSIVAILKPRYPQATNDGALT
jgi:hypothetical protein